MTTLKAKVAYVLERFPETRSDDVNLAKLVWTTFYPDIATHGVILIDDLHLLPSYDNITRYRRMLSPILPPTPEVAKHRSRKQKERRQEFGVSFADSVKDVL
jgi:hypothetical protein